MRSKPTASARQAITLLWRRATRRRWRRKLARSAGNDLVSRQTIIFCDVNQLCGLIVREPVIDVIQRDYPLGLARVQVDASQSARAFRLQIGVKVHKVAAQGGQLLSPPQKT